MYDFALCKLKKIQKNKCVHPAIFFFYKLLQLATYSMVLASCGGQNLNAESLKTRHCYDIYPYVERM